MYFLCVENCFQLHGPSRYNMYSSCIHLYLPVQTRAGTICTVRAFTRTDQSRPEPVKYVLFVHSLVTTSLDQSIVQYVLFVHSLVPTRLDQSRYNMYCSCIYSYQPVQTRAGTICIVRAFTRTNQSRPEPVQYVLFVHSLVPTSLDQSRYNMYCSCIHSYRPVQTRAGTICIVCEFTRTNQSRPEPVQYVLFMHLLVPTSLDQSQYNMYCLCIHSYRPVQTRAGTICTVRAFTRTSQSSPELVQYVLFMHLLVPTSLDQRQYNMCCSCIHSYQPVQTRAGTICTVRAFTRTDQSRTEPGQYIPYVHSLIQTSLDPV